VYNVQDKPDSGRAVLNFFDWAYHKGGKMAEELDYVPMPDNVIKLVEKTWASNIKDTKGKAVWTGAVK
jgi:phosphate transport system substrate-binding protein